MSSYNRVQIMGNLGKNPEMRFAPSGSPVTSFSVAVNRKLKTKDGENKDLTDWFNIVCWQKTAELANQFLTKGSRVFVEGRLSNRSWDGQDGQKHYRTEIIAQQVIFLDSKGEKSPDQSTPEESSGDIEPSDMPF